MAKRKSGVKKTKSQGLLGSKHVEPKTIPKEIVKDFVGKVKDEFKTEITNIGGTDNYRIDVWVSFYFFEHQVYPSYKVGKSFYVEYRNETEGIVDKTVKSVHGDIDTLLSKKKKKLPSIERPDLKKGKE